MLFYSSSPRDLYWLWTENRVDFKADILYFIHSAYFLYLSGALFHILLHMVSYGHTHSVKQGEELM